MPAIQFSVFSKNILVEKPQSAAVKIVKIGFVKMLSLQISKRTHIQTHTYPH